MNSSLHADSTFFQRLREQDQKLVQVTKNKGCPHCGNKLDTANYFRKPRGTGESECLRFSLCCRSEGCRHRVTPPSLRFLGRKVYSAWVVVLVLDFCKEIGLKSAIGWKTLHRWRQFWAEQLNEAHPFMKWARGVLPHEAPKTSTPGPLLACFGFPNPSSWVSLLRFFTHPI